ncbi:putative lipoprotein [Flammeovirgaceae bacterium 311]|nr:putative lipoprotein [Flammeovirgaceae bacterium 311]
MKYFSSFLAVVFLVLASCSPSVKTDQVSDVNFTEFKTYAYLPSGETESERAVFDESVIREVDQEMQARGYRLDTQEPDLLVLVKSMYEQEEELRRVPVATTYNYYGTGFRAPARLGPAYYPGYANYPTFTGYGIQEVEYTEGTFVVDVINRETGQIIWRGWSSTPVDPMELDSSIRSYVDNIFEEFPVEPQG